MSLPFVDFSLSDYPHAIAAALFLPGCPLRCPYCHNHQIQGYRDFDYEDFTQRILPYLESKQGLLDAFVISGGEPSTQPEILAYLIGELRSKAPRLKLGLHTAGLRPDVVLATLSHWDWIGLDYKAPISASCEGSNSSPLDPPSSKQQDFAAYSQLTGNPQLGPRVLSLCQSLISAGANFELRITLDPHYWTPSSLLQELKFLRELGIERIALQQLIPQQIGGKNYPELEYIPRSHAFFEEDLLRQARQIFPKIEVRQP